MVTDNFPRHGSIDKRILFEEILLQKFGMKLLPILDPKFYPYCVAPIMDSAIVSKYGPNGKDSIIKLVNHLADSSFTAEESKSGGTNGPKIGTGGIKSGNKGS